jgi:hypothetical protein
MLWERSIGRFGMEVWVCHDEFILGALITFSHCGSVEAHFISLYIFVGGKSQTWRMSLGT